MIIRPNKLKREQHEFIEFHIWKNLVRGLILPIAYEIQMTVVANN